MIGQRQIVVYLLLDLVIVITLNVCHTSVLRHAFMSRFICLAKKCFKRIYWNNLREIDNSKWGKLYIYI